MFVSEDLTVNEKNHLVIGKNDTVELAKEFGTPLYVLDEDLIRKIVVFIKTRWINITEETDLSFMQTRLSAHFSLADLLKKKVWVLTLYRAASFIRR